MALRINLGKLVLWRHRIDLVNPGDSIFDAEPFRYHGLTVRLPRNFIFLRAVFVVRHAGQQTLQALGAAVGQIFFEVQGVRSKKIFELPNVG